MTVCWGRRGGCAQFGLRPPAAALCLLLILLLLLLPFAPHSAVAQPAEAGTTVKVLLLKRIRTARPQSMPTAFYAGVYASLWAHNSTAAGDVPVELVKREAKDTEYASFWRK
ncbi:receptor-type adenylate cyclase [Trypanosoma rangeli]|uniref:Receptor-type adenylate cyclase n=1 Tax=Trypanosoma rangeli TaxID=5698 RepID=A0A422N096_TRYRA|nr:receptor-type adenylate cyclase [Trypanosoma rangeli]RNE98880.1 receptor-type adenylate cyclase [Trypanosoma rangeli]|eukprot:RNE98880.1 receptor-type adenylate cyclase [Trypanosoma rangeli]